MVGIPLWRLPLGRRSRRTGAGLQHSGRHGLGRRWCRWGNSNGDAGRAGRLCAKAGPGAASPWALSALVLALFAAWAVQAAALAVDSAGRRASRREARAVCPQCPESTALGLGGLPPCGHRRPSPAPAGGHGRGQVPAPFWASGHLVSSAALRATARHQTPALVASCRAAAPAQAIGQNRLYPLHSLRL